MWRILFGLWFLVGVLPHPAEAQQWTGSAGLALSSGYQTNAYLDPVIRSWDSLSTRSFGTVMPQVGLVREASRSQLSVTSRARLYPGRADAPQFVQGNAQYQRDLSPSWTVGITGGGTRDRFVSSRDSWWTLPSVEWMPSSSSTLTVRGGITRRSVDFSRGITDRQTSALVALNGDTWLTDRLHAEGRLHWSSGRTSLAETSFGGTGLTLRGTYWPTNQWSLEAEVTAEQSRYETTTSSTAEDHIGRAGVTARWHAHSSVTFFAQTRASAAQLEQRDAVESDVHVSVGLRLKTQRVLGGTSESPPTQRVCQATDGGIRVEIPYEGSGTPHLTGDFNGWSLPGTPMTQTGDATWTITLSVPPGEYAYRIRIVDDAERQWLDLPSYAETADDDFGGTNGVCTVP
jgi:hypothetical protein